MCEARRPCLTLPSPLFNRPPPYPWGSINIISTSGAADTNRRVTINNSSSAPCSGIHTAWSLLSRLRAMYEIPQCVLVRVHLLAWLHTFAASKALILATHFLHFTSSCRFSFARPRVTLLGFMPPTLSCQAGVYN